ncbi:hypothetical protein [Rubricoccus marinus]|uniref:hypothetical protein n=1 Tax=Rubricoccus marinus TaxID=716817 RepID=UPI00117B61C7|nr:hypothetical protein [Rubricoccus marinus]
MQHTTRPALTKVPEGGPTLLRFTPTGALAFATTAVDDIHASPADLARYLAPAASRARQRPRRPARLFTRTAPAARVRVAA